MMDQLLEHMFMEEIAKPTAWMDRARMNRIKNLMSDNTSEFERETLGMEGAEEGKKKSLLIPLLFFHVTISDVQFFLATQIICSWSMEKWTLTKRR